MTILTIIVGVLLVIGGIFCLMTPGATLLSIGWFLGLMLLISGIGFIVGYSRVRKVLPISIGSLVLGIITALLGVFLLINQPLRLMTDIIVIYMLGFWILAMGVVRIVSSIQLKSIPGSGWGWLLALGILMTLMGIYSFFHPMVSALTLAWLIGFYIIFAGVDLVILGIAMRKSPGTPAQ